MSRYVFIPVFALTLFSACAQEPAFKNLNSQAFNQKIESLTGTVLDVRTPSEFANGHIPGAGQLNYYALDFKQKLLLLPKDQPVYLYCNTGYRSKRAAEILTENGYKQVYNLERGIMDWNLNNLPVVIEPNAKQDVENKMEPDEFYALIKSDKPVFIDFYAPWCAPCRKMMPMMDSLKTEYKDRIILVKINADASKNLVKELQLGSVPYLAFYKSGNKLFEHNGIISREELVSLFDVR
jgi:thioredoxin